MSRIDVMKSLLRSAAQGAESRIGQLTRTGALRRLVDELATGRNFIADAQLTAAIARLPNATAATVHTLPDGVRIDVAFDDGQDLKLRMQPDGVTFASHGAKELRFRVSPLSAATDARAADALTAIAGEVARALWGPLLPPPEARLALTPVHRDADLLFIDLRGLPAVRAALGQRLRAVGMETISLLAISAEQGGLRLSPKIAGF